MQIDRFVHNDVLSKFDHFAANLEDEIPAAFILGAERAHGLAMVRSLGRRGIPVVMLGAAGSPGMRSRFGFPVPTGGLGTQELLALLTWLGERLPTRGALLPTADAHALLLSRHEEKLARHFRFALPEREILEKLADKRLQYQLAARCGIPTPRTLALDCVKDLDRVPGELGFPCILKPAYSDEWNQYRLSQAAGVRLGKVLAIDSPAALLQAYGRMTAACSGVIAQEWVEGDADQLYAVYAHCETEGSASSLLVRRELRDWPVYCGSGTYSISVLDPEPEFLARRLCKSTGYRGLANIEFKRDARDGQLKLIEFNVRGASQLALAVDSGVDLPFAAYASLAGHAIDAASSEPMRAGVRWIDFGTDALSARVHRRRGSLGWVKWIGDVLRSRSFAYFALDDLRPGLARAAELLRGSRAAFTHSEKEPASNF